MRALVFAMALDLSPLTIGVIVVVGVLFIAMFGISSAFGGYQGIFDWTQEKPGDQKKR
ncbi:MULTISPECIES: hypothetical protein [Prochlorococcus]|nr:MULTISPECIES: hypothetical protein [Prochlorococcus]MCH2565863.1 hypothetical protein [Prochlorococcus sp. ALOHA_A2.0_51]KZR65595.1 hypothetical protein PMIT1306_00507 [Prochlorococcus sp. MIT 1306]KZR66468.1 hypothetical protein PMIT1312_00933 [Prochlorococcus marinus str. MIT 1312]KZR68106.1 hypothetical protein PMIT1303_00130 [Prochlorococcus sp. MIT 1303]KZR77611.1 hypothetical protein PMIT1320_00381 [Prochlorococcus marinus str. MIT 1320]|tara:strand:+ start:260 stop:433 length:174 start_codon:yes stop_codon:yes gene_type:complete